MTGQILQSLQNKKREMETGPLNGTGTAKASKAFSHWTLARQDDVAWLFLDKADSSANTLSQAVIQELGAVLEQLDQTPPKGLIIRSLKANGFCMGADIHEFADIENEAIVRDRLTEAHQIVDRLAALPYPTVAVIHGQCLGGGLELALCCKYRLAAPGAKMGFPEVQLGLHPGLGGTARLTHLIDPMQAMTMMLTGKTLDAGRAKSAGLVDDVVEERHIAAAAQAAIKGRVEANDTSFKERVLTSTIARKFEARQMRSKAAEKAPPEHYPAPGALIDLWENYGNDAEAMRQKEIASFATLLTSPASKNLVRVFFLREEMKSLTRKDADKIRHVHVIGAGAMGGDIAGWCAFKGLKASLYDMEGEAIVKAVRDARKLCQKKHLSDREERAVMDRLIPDFANDGVRQADLVIEAVPEKADIKLKVYQDAEPRMKAGALLATNTSSIPLDELAGSLKRPERFVGLHFFNPVAKMQLVEIVKHEGVSEETLDRAHRFVGQIDRLPAPVRSSPGFLVNRALMPYLLEAVLMVDEGVDPKAIDKVAEDFGMPMGPVELADQVGLDICLSVGEMLGEKLDVPIPEFPGWFREKVDDGKLGKKTGEGFYKWKDGEAQKKSSGSKAPDDTLDRLILPMLNACMTCLTDEVIDSADVLDGAMIFGTGFAPFRGGPMHYARSRGYDNIRTRLQTLKETAGPRFQPDDGWHASSTVQERP
ncbi:3-hydroxyacyl-CoA dehydrogenase NAD-binding domain-containing protein [Allohahella marinimesophila]|uniref:enoyl-CoA hydratase n=2 Tax=Allohahella marinimesophila TaxID=1054972 RepID=A0ABP7PS20_9GAMM